MEGANLKDRRVRKRRKRREGEGSEKLESQGAEGRWRGSLPWKSLLIDRWPQGQVKGRSLWPRAWAGCERIRAHKLGRVCADTRLLLVLAS